MRYPYVSEIACTKINHSSKIIDGYAAGMPMADQERNAPLHYTWEQSAYLATRKEELAGILEDIEPFKPVS